MKSLVLVIIGVLFLGACSQFATNDKERGELQGKAEQDGAVYLDCVTSGALAAPSGTSVDVANLVAVAAESCQVELEAYKNSQNAFLKSQFMATSKPLQESVDALNTQAVNTVTAAMIERPSSPAVQAAPAAATAAAATAVAITEPDGTAANWSSEQRVYLDCMEDQARKYASLDESATVIADVAQSRCKSYLAGPNTNALAAEGRTLVMGAVLDARLESQPAAAGQPNP